jgi:threonine/homoserine/homoserine lactone efflux protein
MDPATLTLYAAAALLLAVTPGPGLLYVTARSLAGGRAEGIASSFGTALGGLVHVLAGAVGVSALVMASAEAFTALKFLGAAYLVFIGIQTMRHARLAPELAGQPAFGTRRAFRDGALIEALNPKTAAFFLAFIPQFLDPAAGSVAWQFVLLGCVSVALNTAADLVAAFAAGAARARLAQAPRLIARLRFGSGALMCGLGVVLAAARRPT